MDTSPSLLERLHRPTDSDAWGQFVELYTPLLFYWARGLGLQEADAADLIQDVFVVLVQKLPEFNYDPLKSFRGWLRKVLINTWRDKLRRRGLLPVEPDDAALAGIADPHGAAEVEETEYTQHLVARALQLMQAAFEPNT